MYIYIDIHKNIYIYTYLLHINMNSHVWDWKWATGRVAVHPLELMTWMQQQGYEVTTRISTDATDGELMGMAI